MRRRYGNGIEREELVFPNHGLIMSILSAVRQGNGRWSVAAELCGKIDVGDGRTILVDRVVHINCDQRGRKPRKEKQCLSRH